MKYLKWAGIAALVAIVIVAKTITKENEYKQAKEICIQAVTKLPTYEADKAFILTALDKHYDTCFKGAYRPSTKRSAGGLDGDAFIVTLFSSMSTTARESGKEALAFDILQLKDQLRYALSQK
jgi:hypothetical protein